jgi:hypothetical protein
MLVVTAKYVQLQITELNWFVNLVFLLELSTDKAPWHTFPTNSEPKPNTIF